MTVPITPIIMTVIEMSSFLLTTVDRYSRGELTEEEVLEEMTEGVNVRAVSARQLWELADKI